MSAPVFEFELHLVEGDDSGYYHPRWDRAKKVVVLAATEAQAFGKAYGLLGDCPRGRGWSWRGKCVSVREVECDPRDVLLDRIDAWTLDEYEWTDAASSDYIKGFRDAQVCARGLIQAGRELHSSGRDA